eukprot:1592599-Prymnesium_polylepis.1
MAGVWDDRWDGGRLPAYIERPRHGSPSELYGPSRLLMRRLRYERHSGVLLYAYLRTSEPRRQRA